MNKSLKNAILASELFILVLAVSYYFSRFWIDGEHDGLLFKPALDILQEKMLFRDTFTQYGALSILIHSAFIKIFGIKLLSVKLATSFFYALSAVVLYFFGIKYFSKILSFTVVIVWLLIAPYFVDLFFTWSSVYGSFFALCSLLFLYRSFEGKQKNKMINLFLTGGYLSFSFWSKQPFILIFIVLVFLFVLLRILKVFTAKQTIKYLSNLCGGFILFSLPLFFWIVLNGAFTDWLKQTFWIGYIWGRIIASGFSYKTALNFIFRSKVFLVIIVGIIGGFILSLLNLSKEKSIVNIRNFVIYSISLPILVQLYPTFDHSHLYWAITPIIVPSVYFYKRIFDRVSGPYHKKELKPNNYLQGAFIIIAIIMTILGVGQIFFASGLNKISGNYVVIERPSILKGIYVDSETEKHYRETNDMVKKYFDKYPEKSLVNISNEILYLMFTDKSVNINRMYSNYEGYTSGVYPYEKMFYEFIGKNRPMAITRYSYQLIADNYCRTYESKRFNVAFYIPLESADKNCSI